MSKSLQKSNSLATPSLRPCGHKLALFFSIVRAQYLLSLAVVRDGTPYCANLFYAFEPPFSLIVASSAQSEHIKAALRSPQIAGTIASETSTIRNIRGIQFVGTLTQASAAQRGLYIAHFPIARTIPSDFWNLTITWSKITDNAFLGLGKKMSFDTREICATTSRL